LPSKALNHIAKLTEYYASMNSSIFSMLSVLSLLFLLSSFLTTWSLQRQYGSSYHKKTKYVRSSLSLIVGDNDIAEDNSLNSLKAQLNNDVEQVAFGREDNNQEIERTEENSLSSLRAQLNKKDHGADNNVEQVDFEREHNNEEIERAEDNSLKSLKAQLNNDIMTEEADFEREDNNKETERAEGNSLNSIKAQLAKENVDAKDKSLLPKCYVIISNLQSGSNIGSICRNALAFNVHEVVVVGRRGFRDKMRQADRGAKQRQTFVHFNSVAEASSYLKESRGCSIVGVEIMDTAVSLTSLPFTQSTAFMFGNEGGGLSERQRGVCDKFTYIPQYAEGGMASINVACASAVVLQTFAVWAKFTETQRLGEKFI
jgi:tRNA G18 (ribose-2'-O)-methylase SpoU